ncbi:hypothetical protein FACS189485_22010 [Spirochaetia bacterium]|nr:hypothetical protein FACS189485_22010 [Spirochaetia bacterium]
MIYEDEFVPAIDFWPEDDVRAAFTEADKAIGTEGEAVALRVFYQRMKFHLKTSATINSSPDMEERMIEHYERPRLDAEIARLEGRPPVPCAGCPFTGCNHKGGA